MGDRPEGVAKEMLVAAVLQDHKEIHGTDSDFAMCCTHFTITKRVEADVRAIGKRDEETSLDQQLILPGYKRVQKEYIVEREEEARIIAVQHMTEDEVLKKARQHRAMGDGHYEHADELEKYLEDRRVSGRNASLEDHPTL